MPMIQLDKETNEPVTYYTETEVIKIVDDVVDEAEEWCEQDTRVVADRILFEHNIEVKK